MQKKMGADYEIKVPNLVIMKIKKLVCRSN